MIVRMSHVLVLGPRRSLPEALRRLQVQGVLQIRELPEGLGHGRVRKIPAEEEQLSADRLLEGRAHKLHDLLLLLPTPDGVPSEERLPDVAAADFDGRLEALESEIRGLNQRRLALQEERDLLARYERLLTALVPLTPELEEARQVETVGMLVRRDRPEVLTLLEEDIRRITGGAYALLSREVDREQTAVLVSVPRELAADLSRFLFERGITEIRLPERYADRPFVSALALLIRRSRELPAELSEVERGLLACSQQWYAPLQQALRAAHDRLARLRAIARCGETKHAFIISGWVPAERYGGLASALEETFQGRVILVEIPIRDEEYGEVPVVLRNPGFLKPFELLLSLLPPPRYGSIDPTPFVAGFFPLFFGVMLGDVGYGGLALVLALLARARRWGGELGQNLATIALACSVSAIVFGILFGELFGGLGTLVGLRPLLCCRREDVLPLLGLALGLGGLHILLGVSLALWSALRHGRVREACIKLSALALILAAITGFLARLGLVPAALGRGALLSLGPLLVLSVLLEGFLAPLELVLIMVNIVSYARLMALGVASVMLADVATRMAEFFRPAAVGLAMAVLFHGVNLALGLFSPTIQALRLHYVEFFDKFYQVGGRPYEPFALTA